MKFEAVLEDGVLKVKAKIIREGNNVRAIVPNLSTIAKAIKEAKKKNG